jgi:hypothetical protein
MVDARSMLGLGATRPSMQYQQLNQAFQSDPRRILGQTLMGQGASSAPVRTPLQGLGRLSSALVGAYLQRKAGDAQVARETEMTDAILSGLPEAMRNNPLIQSNPAAVGNAAVAAMLQPKITQDIVDSGDLAFVQTNSQSPFSETPTTSISGLMQRRAPKDSRTSAMKNAEAQGLVPGSAEYNAFIAKSGSGTTVNMTTSPGSKAMVSAYDKLAGGATTAQTTLGKVDEMLNLLDAGVDTGFGQDLSTNMKRLGQFFNPEYEVQSVAGAEAFRGTATQLILPLVKQLGVNPTDKDLTFVELGSPTLSKSIEGNKLLLRAIKLSQARNIALFQAANDFISANPGIEQQGLQGNVRLQQHLLKTTQTNPLFTQGAAALADDFERITGQRPPASTTTSVTDQLINQGLIR